MHGAGAVTTVASGTLTITFGAGAFTRTSGGGLTSTSGGHGSAGGRAGQASGGGLQNAATRLSRFWHPAPRPSAAQMTKARIRTPPPTGRHAPAQTGRASNSLSSARPADLSGPTSERLSGGRQPPE